MPEPTNKRSLGKFWQTFWVANFYILFVLTDRHLGRLERRVKSLEGYTVNLEKGAIVQADAISHLLESTIELATNRTAHVILEMSFTNFVPELPQDAPPRSAPMNKKANSANKGRISRKDGPWPALYSVASRPAWMDGGGKLDKFCLVQTRLNRAAMFIFAASFEE